jgi:leader peptidase (prepilin peptidase)/N-methyltransferase
LKKGKEDMEVYNLILAVVFGILIGSFLNVVILRIPKKESIVFPASHCPTCKTPLKWWHNIPIISYIFLKGKCAFCKEKISIQYPLIELTSGVIVGLVYYKNGFDIYSLMLMASFLSLLVSSIVDLKYKAITYIMNVLPVTFAIFSSSNILENLTNALILAGGAVFIRDYVSAFINKEAMGDGDILVFATMGAILGIKLSLMALFLGAVLAIFPAIYNRIAKKDLELPFIPFLSLGLFIVWLFENQFLEIWNKLYA